MDAIGGAFMVIPIVAVYVFMLVVVWRFMRAHESIAESLKVVAQNFKREP